MQLEPIKPMLKAPAPMLLKLRYEDSLLSFAFNFNTCRYTVAALDNFSPDTATQAAAASASLRPRQGKAVQVDPTKSTLKAPGIKLLNLKDDKPLSNFAFKFNLRRYTKGALPARVQRRRRRSTYSFRTPAGA